MAPEHHKQHYALNSNNEIVYINDAKPELENYYCLSCGEPMIPKRGQVRTWHYAHKTNTINCSYETYLHTLAKYLLCERFSQVDTFKVKVKVPIQCKYISNCIWAEEESLCKWDGDAVFDLKSFYNRSACEQLHGGYRADVLLFNESNKYPPVFLEICVSHPCSREKIDSGIKIIEVVINKESDLEKILNAEILEEGHSVRVYNFQRRVVNEEPIEKKHLHKVTLFENDKMIHTISDCRAYLQHRPKAKMEVCVDVFLIWSDSLYDYGAIVATSVYPDFRTCNMCRYHSGRMDEGFEERDKEPHRYPIFCKLYKKFGTEKYCSPSAAKECVYYKLFSREQQREIMQQFPKHHIWVKEE